MDCCSALGSFFTSSKSFGGNNISWCWSFRFCKHQIANHTLQRPVFALNISLFLWLPGRTISASGATGPFRAFPKSLSVDFGGLNHPQAQPLPQSLSQQQQQQHQQQPGGVGHATTTAPPVSGSNASDRYAAVLQLDSVFSDTTPTTGGEAFELRVDGFSILCYTHKKKAL